MKKLCELLCAMCYFGPVIMVGVMSAYTSQMFNAIESENTN